ncbi:hypothetical protein JW935_05835 [candidate division KSB1 bacterium]|nr:hypothetical protein [candidate division KSB1 bacterium]
MKRSNINSQRVKINFLHLLATGLVLLYAQTAVIAQGIQMYGFTRNYTGVLLNDANEYSIVQNTLDLDLTHSRDRISIKANPYLYHYSDAQVEIDLREVYMDVYFDKIDLRIGKQQIIWGKANGVFITDIVSPKDLREFLLPDFDEIRMGVTAVKADYYMGNHTFEVVWLPVFTPTRMPGEGSIWRPSMDFPVESEFDYSRQEVKGALENSELFAKYSAITPAIDFEIMVGYAWDDDPTMHIRKTIDPQTMQPASLTVIPRHHRLGIGGGSFSSTLGPFVVRGEGAYYTGKYFNTADPTVTHAVVKKDYLHYLLGVDYTLWEINLSGQFIQQAILKYDAPIEQDEFENTATFLARRDFLRETLTVELFTYIGLNNNDALIRPRMYYDLADGFELLLGANLFTGDKGRFGQFRNNDMVYFKVKYSF